MLVEGMVLGTMSFIGFAVTYTRLHPKVKLVATKYPLATDLVCVVFFYSIMGMTLPAHVACATMSIMMMLGMHVERNKQDYAFIYGFLDEAKIKLGECRDKLKKLNEEYKSRNQPILKAV